MTLHAASREALSFAKSRLDDVLGDAGADPSAVGEDLLSVVDLLTKEIGLRRAVSDGSSDPEARKQLVAPESRVRRLATEPVRSRCSRQRWRSRATRQVTRQTSCTTRTMAR